MISGEWKNVVYTAEQPNFWFWSLEALAKYLFDINYFTPIIIILSFIGLIKTKDRFMKFFFLACFIFSVYHIPNTQLKIFDMLTIPSAILASVGILELSRYARKYRMIVITIFILTMFSFQTYHFYHAKNFWFIPDVSPEPPLYMTAIWLGNYDKDPSKIYVDSAPAWFGMLSNKIPMEPEISYLEKFSEDYLNQLELRRMIKERLESGEDIRDLANQAGLKYVITKEQTSLSQVYSEFGWFVYEV
jgi:hypothetical protein